MNNDYNHIRIVHQITIRQANGIISKLREALFKNRMRLGNRSDLKGKKYLLLTFFPKCFTGTCSKQLESLRNAWPQLQESDIEVWGVSVVPAEGEKGQRAFAEFLKLPFPLLPDTGHNLSILYGAANSPNQTSARMSVLIDKQSIVRWIDKQINPTTHGLDVVAKVKELEKVYSE